MARLVASIADIKKNLRILDRYSHGTADERRFHARTIANGRIFVAEKTAGRILFGPSKFAGYKNNDINHIQHRADRNGRVTNRKVSTLIGRYLESDDRGYAAIERTFRAYCRSMSIQPSTHPRARRYWVIDGSAPARNSVPSTHILQGGTENGDKRWLERAAKLHLRSRSWIAPKSVDISDRAIIYVQGHGLFATAEIDSEARPRRDWRNRYGAALNKIRLIEPPISLDVLRERLPSLRWAKYPRSITTLSNILARRLNGTISTRKSEGVGDVASLAPEKMSDHELRALAIACARRRLPVKIRSIKYRNRSTIIHRYVLRRAGGECEGCRHGAPFAKEDGSPYLEPHHTLRVADDGPDHPATVIALCPNCHRRVHYSSDRMEYNKVLRKKLKQIEPRTRS